MVLAEGYQIERKTVKSDGRRYLVRDGLSDFFMDAWDVFPKRR